MGRKSWRTTVNLFVVLHNYLEGQVTNCPGTSTAKLLNHGTVTLLYIYISNLLRLMYCGCVCFRMPLVT